MRDFGVIFERVPLMSNNTGAISVAKNQVFYKRMRHLERIHHFLRDHVEKRDIEMRYIGTDSWPIFSPNPLIPLILLLCGGELVFAILMAWFEGGLMLYLVYLYIFPFSCIFFILT
jgi:hypothetical protein